jgi:hypothetical protein
MVSFTAVFATNKPGSKYHSFLQYHNWRKALKTAGKPQRDVAWSDSDRLGNARAGPMRQKPTTDPVGAQTRQIPEFALARPFEAKAAGSGSGSAILL